MNKIKAIPYDKNLCFHCLKKVDNTHKIYFGPLGYGSRFDECSTMLQLCDDCFNKAPNAIKNPEYENEDSEFGPNYKNEDKIFDYIDNLPAEGQQFVKNKFWEDDHGPMDPQDWLDYFINKDLPYEKAKDYGLYALEEIKAYKERFPKCEYPVNRLFSDGSYGCYCPFGASGNKDQKDDPYNISTECFTCKYYKERTSKIKTIKNKDLYEYFLKVKDRINKNKPLEEEIIIFVNYGIGVLPEKIRKEEIKNPRKMPLKDRRGAVVEKLKKSAMSYDNMSLLSQEEFDSLMDTGKIIYFKDRDLYYYKIDGFIKEAKIVKVDTARYWTIEEYDGSESIKYIDFKILDQEIGYVKFK